MRYSLAVVILVALAACSGGKKDYRAVANCRDAGHSPGTQAYDNCIQEENAALLMEQQRREYEQMKQNERDWKMRNY